MDEPATYRTGRIPCRRLQFNHAEFNDSPAAREETEDLLLLPRLIAVLLEPDRTVIVLGLPRPWPGRDRRDIGYSKMQVSRLLRRALASLRAPLLDS